MAAMFGGNSEEEYAEKSEEDLFKDFSEEDTDDEYYDDMDGFDPNEQTSKVGLTEATSTEEKPDKIASSDQSDQSDSRESASSSSSEESNYEEQSYEENNSVGQIDYEKTSEEESTAKESLEKESTAKKSADYESAEEERSESIDEDINMRPRSHAQTESEKLLRKITISKPKSLLNLLQYRHTPSHLLDYLIKKDSEKLLNQLMEKHFHNQGIVKSIIFFF